MSDQIKDDDSTCDDTNGIHSQNANITPAEPEKAALEDAPEGDSVEESVSIPSILQDLRVTDALRCMPRIEKIYRKQHMYFAQWQGLRTTPVTEHMEAMKSICRYEASGLQMRGIGLWLLSQILSNCAVHGDGTMTATAGSGDDNDATAYTEEDEQAANSALTEVQINGLMESLLRIAVEQRSTAATTCTSILRLLINRYEVSPTNIFDIGE